MLFSWTYPPLLFIEVYSAFNFDKTRIHKNMVFLVVLQKRWEEHDGREAFTFLFSLGSLPNRRAINAAWHELSPLFPPCLCPFLSRCLTSSPGRVRHAICSDKKPIPGFTSRLMNRGSRSTMVLRYVTCRSSHASGTLPSALSSPGALGYAAF